MNMRSIAQWTNTLVAAAASAGLTLASVGVLLVMSNAIGPGDAAPFSWFSAQLAQAQGLGGGEEILAFALSVVAGLAGTLMTLIELRLLLPSGGAVLLISDEPYGRTTIERESVESYLALAAHSITHVEAAQIRVRSNRDGTLRVKARLSLSPNRDTIVPDAAHEAREMMTDSASDQLGLQIADLAVTTAMRPTRADRKRKRLQLA